mmetsp:Transcript_2734/g.4064  ORF Transcript_2734/g.4064 Transcript_2734/m.4064 type:complete len:275 (-) Transcript_2734:91-915(-)|eukprot:CAMPEP_0194217420 /NCGR_PEP_ID=MMETSP0156-20130528/21245_1 /TAXON_ID=33649 /ORGANISM="Thalassionema nitzschioides, Strain L26-B" /LENGTH=274 /DNA_ID=CAMNT_0038946465 /DNA_START=1787 /DNA_END=2611 /DNA_ORIENTATION=+
MTLILVKLMTCFVGITFPSLCINSKDPKWSNGYNNCPSDAYNGKGIGEDVGQCWIDCDGSFSRVHRFNLLDGFAAAGIDKTSFERVVEQEQQHGPGAMTVGALYPAIQQYVWREGYTRWPDASNWPFIEEAGLSTCTEKGATGISMVTTAAAPWSVVVADSANRTAGGANDLCQNFNEDSSWCPAYQNPLQKTSQKDPTAKRVNLILSRMERQNIPFLTKDAVNSVLLHQTKRTTQDTEVHTLEVTDQWESVLNTMIVLNATSSYQIVQIILLV